MSGLVLSLRQPLREPLGLDAVTPDRLLAAGVADTARLPVWVGRRQAELGEFFAVSATDGAGVHVEGDLALARDLARGMSAGELIVDGNVGDDVACGMSGGTLVVRGNAGDRLGSATPGAAKGMTGGEIVVTGSVGRDVAARARRGLVLALGDAGEDAGRAMIAGSLIVLGAVGANAGRGSKRGSIVAGAVQPPETYRYACTYRPPHLRLAMTYLRRRYGVKIHERFVTGLYRRHCGDAGRPGKGEILEWVSA